MFQKLFFCCCFLCTSISVFSQDTIFVKESKLPSSFYIKNNNSSILMTSFMEDLKLNGFKFLIFNDENLMNNSFTIDLRNIGRPGSQFSYESYKDFDLYKHLPAVPDIIILNRFNKNVLIKAN